MATKSKATTATTATADATPTKVAKLVRTTKQAPATKATKQAPATKATKQAPATKATKQRAPAQRYAGRKIRLLVKPSEAPEFRGGRATRWAMVVKAKTTDEVLGAQYANAAGEMVEFDSSNFAPFIAAGLIAID